jgi:hypothetical protein
MSAMPTMPTNIDTVKALELRINNGLSYAKIGAIQGVSAQAIHQRIKHLLPTPVTKMYQEKRADILDHVQLTMISQLDKVRLKKMSARDAAVSFGIFYDKSRLERDQSTSIISMTDDQLDARLRDLVAREQAVDAIPVDAIPVDNGYDNNGRNNE